MDERLLLGVCLHRRKAYEDLMALGCTSGEFTETARVVFDALDQQYRQDGDVRKIDFSLLRSQIERRYGRGSMADSAVEYAENCPSNASGVNVAEEYRLLRLHSTSTRLATLLASGDHSDETQQEVDKYRSLVAGEAGEEFKERLTIDDFTEDSGERIKLYPSTINRCIKGGVHRGNNIVIFGRPNSAKTMLAINNAACLAKSGYKVLYVGNEEPPMDITRRLLSRMAKMDIDDLEDRDKLKEAFKRAGKAYNRNWVLLHKANCTYQDIRRAAARLKPDVIIVDQLKNVHVKEDNRALQLDKLARQVRELGIEFGCVTISVTQAGESAEGRLTLGMSDVEWSNTGIPGAADLMIGLGVNDEFNGRSQRMLNICKNKLKNWHGHFPVVIDPQQTRVLGAG